MTSRRRFWAFARLVLAAAVALTAASIMLYPGGTVMDESTRGYSFAHNFLSDLGSTVAFNNQRNLAGAILFGLAVLIGAFTLALCIVATVRLLSNGAGRPLSRLAAITGVVVCFGFLGVAITPEDRLLRLHKAFGLTAFHIFPALTMFLAAATIRDDRFRIRATAGWVVLSLVLAGFLAIGHLGPNVGSEYGLTVQVLTQKIVVSAILVVLWFESREAELASGQPLGQSVNGSRA